MSRKVYRRYNPTLGRFFDVHPVAWTGDLISRMFLGERARRVRRLKTRGRRRYSVSRRS